MLHIILGILKVIFILIGIVLGLILGVVLIALFVPVRYRVQAVKDNGRLQAQARITFLLRILSVRITAGRGEAPGIAVRVFGILLPLFGNRKPKKRRRRSAPSRESADSSGDGNAGSIDEVYDEAGGDGGWDDAAPTDAQTESDADDDKDAVAIAGTHGKTDADSNRDIDVRADSSSDGLIKEPDTVLDHSDSGRPCTVPHPDPSSETSPEDDRSAGFLQRLLQMLSLLLQRLRAAGARIQAVWDRLRAVRKRLVALPGQIRQLRERLCRLAAKPGELLEFAQKYEVRAILADALVYLKRLLKHSMPRRLRGWIRFGTGDPALTGELTGVLYLILPVRASEFSVEPDFTEKLFETELDAAGHIRACHLVYVLIRMICDRRVRRLIRAYRKRK